MDPRAVGRVAADRATERVAQLRLGEKLLPVPPEARPSWSPSDHGDAVFERHRLHVLRESLVEPERRLRIVMVDERVGQLVQQVLAYRLHEIAAQAKGWAALEIVVADLGELAGPAFGGQRGKVGPVREPDHL